MLPTLLAVIGIGAGLVALSYLAVRNSTVTLAILLAVWIATSALRDSVDLSVVVSGHRVWALDLLSVSLASIGIVRILSHGVRSLARGLVLAIALLLAFHISRGIVSFGTQTAINEARSWLYFTSALLYAATVPGGWNPRAWKLIAATGILLAAIATLYFVIEGVPSPAARIFRDGQWHRATPIVAAGALLILQAAILAPALRWPSRRTAPYIALGAAEIVVLLQHRTLWITGALVAVLAFVWWAREQRSVREASPALLATAVALFALSVAVLASPRASAGTPPEPAVAQSASPGLLPGDRAAVFREDFEEAFDTSIWDVGTGWTQTNGAARQVISNAWGRLTATGPSSSRYDLEGSSIVWDAAFPNTNTDPKSQIEGWLYYQAQHRVGLDALAGFGIIAAPSSKSRLVPYWTGSDSSLSPTGFGADTGNHYWDGHSWETSSAGATLDYDPTADRYLRVRESGGTMHWEASPNGTAWTELARDEISRDVRFRGGYFGIMGGTPTGAGNGQSWDVRAITANTRRSTDSVSAAARASEGNTPNPTSPTSGQGGISSGDSFRWRVIGWRELLSSHDAPTNLAIGQGAGAGFDRVIDGSPVGDSPHNEFVDAYIRFGLLGVLCLIWLGWVLWSRRSEVAAQTGLTPQAIGLLIASQLLYGMAYGLDAIQGLIAGMLVGGLAGATARAPNEPQRGGNDTSPRQAVRA